MHVQMKNFESIRDGIIWVQLCEMIAASKVPGFDIVQDACGADDPIVLYNEHLFTNMNKPEFGQSFTRKENLAAYVDWIVAGDCSPSARIYNACNKESECGKCGFTQLE